MYLKRYKTFGDDIFNRSISDFVGTDYTVNQPAVNVVELEDRFDIQVAAPGLEKKDFTVKVEKDHLIVSAMQEKTEEVTEGKFTRKEFNYESFTRKFYLPKSINKEEISAEYNHGILVISLNKKEEEKEKAAMEIAIK